MIKKLLIAPVLFCFLSAFSAVSSSDYNINAIEEKNSIEFNSELQENSQSAPDFTISPNPATSKLNIRLKKIEASTTLTVFDVLGKKIISKELDQLNTTLDVSRWNNGVYLVRLTSDKETQTKRFVKQ